MLTVWPHKYKVGHHDLLSKDLPEKPENLNIPMCHIQQTLGARKSVRPASYRFAARQKAYL